MPDIEIPVGDEQLAQPRKPERKPTVRFTMEEALPIQEALNYYFGGLKETVGSPALHKIQQRLAKFIEKFGSKEAS